MNTNFTCRIIRTFMLIIATAVMPIWAQAAFNQAVIIDHTCTNINAIPRSAIEQAVQSLHIAYGHTSHGSQITEGMTGLVDFANNGGLGLQLPRDIFQWNQGGTNGALDLHDYAMDGDAGYYPQWVDNTRNYLGSPEAGTGRGSAHPMVNVIMWAWCGQVSGKYANGTLTSEYLTPMSQLEQEYPGIIFVYMTGHLDHWDDANNKAANQMIRNYCLQNKKVLYDFADIESYDPDVKHFEFAGDDCTYYASATGNALGNWAQEWQNSHVQGTDWYDCGAAHSEPLNANRKAYAAWWLWARLSGWSPDQPSNQAPSAPQLISPADGETGLSLTPELRTGAFSDPDSGDTHSQSHWQVAGSADFSNLIYNNESTVSLTTCRLPEALLSSGVLYYWRVRHVDNHGTPSAWSATRQFTTLSAVSEDADGDGIPDTQEINDQTVDLDSDGNADINQAGMKCLKTCEGNVMAAIKQQAGILAIQTFKSVAGSSITNTTNRPAELPFGLLQFSLQVQNAGDTAQLTIHFSQPAAATAHWYKYDSTHGWTDFSAHATFSADRKCVTLELQDGGFGDADGLANGIIVDPSGPGTVSTPESGNTGSGGSSGGNCFIGSMLDFDSSHSTASLDRTHAHRSIIPAFQDQRQAARNSNGKIVGRE